MARLEWLFVGALAVAFAPALIAMSEIWGQVDYYSHGYLVPVVSLWAAIAQSRVLSRLPAGRDARGLLVIGCALALYLVGLTAGLVWLQGLCVVGAASGGVLYLRGPSWLSSLRFPLFFLLFMIPLPASWLAPVITQLQLVVSSTAAGILQSFEFAVYRDGNVMVIPGGHELFVAEACSGITSIVTLLPLAVVLGYFTERTLGRRLILVAAVVPIAMLGNLIRVMGTVIASARWGADLVVESSIHELAGLMVYVVGCLALIGVGSLMRVLAPESSEPRAQPSEQTKQ